MFPKPFVFVEEEMMNKILKFHNLHLFLCRMLPREM